MSKSKCIPYGSDVSAGTYKCADCGYEYDSQSTTSMPPCPQLKKQAHPQKCWFVLTGVGDAVADPYPRK